MSELNITNGDVFEAEVQRACEGRDNFSLFVVDMSNVKKLFVRSGRIESRAFLTSVAQMLQRVCREHDKVFRIGDYTFGLIFDAVNSEVLQQLAAEKICRLYQSAINEAGLSFEGGLHIGIAAFPAHSESAPELVSYAGIALESAEQKQEPYRVYSSESHQTMSMKWAIQDDLAKAIEGGQLDVVYQPQVALSNRTPVGAEALVRWNHPEIGPVSPSVFVSLASDIGLIRDLTNMVLTQALRDASEWPLSKEKQRVSVNLEASLIRSPELQPMVASALSIWGSDHVELTLEITESMLMEESEANSDRLEQLRALGVSIAIDDFGTGYSSLAQFDKMSANELKIDRSFVQNLQGNDRNRNLVGTIISLAKGFDMRTVAEGVENRLDVEILDQLGCDVIQGYYFSEPLPQDEYRDWLSESLAWKQPGALVSE